MLIWRDEWRLVLTSGCARRATPCSVTSVRLVRTRAEVLGRLAWGAVGAFGCLLSARCARSALHGVKKTRGAMAIQGLQSPCQSELMVESYDQIKIQSTVQQTAVCAHCGRGRSVGLQTCGKGSDERRTCAHYGRPDGLQTRGKRGQMQAGVRGSDSAV